MCRWKKVQFKGKIKMKKTRENFPLIIFFYLFDGKKINNLKDFHLCRKREKKSLLNDKKLEGSDFF